MEAFDHIFHRGFDKWQVLGVDAASEAAKNEDEMRFLAKKIEVFFMLPGGQPIGGE